MKLVKYIDNSGNTFLILNKLYLMVDNERYTECYRFLTNDDCDFGFFKYRFHLIENIGFKPITKLLNNV